MLPCIQVPYYLLINLVNEMKINEYIIYQHYVGPSGTGLKFLKQGFLA